MHQGFPSIQSAGCARSALGYRAAELHSARARARQGVLRGMACDGRGRSMSARYSLLEMPGADLRPAPRAATALIMIDARHEYPGMIAAGGLPGGGPAPRGR